MDAYNYTVVICPPSAPPPSPPPDFNSWSQQVPAWFWVMFVCTALFTVVGGISIAYSLRVVHATRRDMVALGSNGGRNTADTLSRLETQVSRMCSGL